MLDTAVQTSCGTISNEEALLAFLVAGALGFVVGLERHLRASQGIMTAWNR